MLNKHNRSSRRGSILSEYLFVLVIFVLLIQIFNSCLILIDKSLNHKSIVDDEVAIMQLRKTLLLAYEIENNGTSLNYEYQNRNFTLSAVNNNLIIQPGTQIILFDIENLNFFNSGNNIYIYYEKDSESFEKILCKT